MQFRLHYWAPNVCFLLSAAAVALVCGAGVPPIFEHDFGGKEYREKAEYFKVPYPQAGDFSASVTFTPLEKVLPDKKSGMVFAFGSGYYDGFRLSFRPDGQGGTIFTAWVGQGKHHAACNSFEAVPIGCPTHVTIVKSGCRLSLYVAGYLSASTECLPGVFPPANGKLGVGNVGYGASPAALALQKLRVWDTPLTPEDIRAEAEEFMQPTECPFPHEKVQPISTPQMRYGRLKPAPAEAFTVRVTPTGTNTFEAALRAIRSARKRGLKGAAAITFAAGTYHMARTLRITHEDSGTAQAPLVLRPEKGGKVIFTGTIPAQSAAIRFRNASWVERPAFPTNTFLAVAEVLDSTNRIFRTDAKLPVGLLPGTELEAIGYWDKTWLDYTLRVKVIDPHRGIFAFVNPTKAPQVKAGRNFRLLNHPAFGNSEVLEGDQCWGFSDPFISVSDCAFVRVEGFVFELGANNGVIFTRSPEAIFAGNVVRAFGKWGFIAKDCDCLSAHGNIFSYFGEGALRVETGHRDTLRKGEVWITNNEIAHNGLLHRTYTQGLHLMGCGAVVAGNYFHDMPSSAIRPDGNDFIIAFNRFERCVLESDDQGATDTWGDISFAGNHYEFNLFRDIGGNDAFSPTGQGGVRLDDAISGAVIYGNRFIRSARGNFGGVQIHGGRLNRVSNNLFSGGPFALSVSPWRREHWRKFIRLDSVTNAIYRAHYPGIEKLPSREMVNEFTRNIIVDVGKVVNERGLRGVYLAGNIVTNALPNLTSLAQEGKIDPFPAEDEIGPVADDWLSTARAHYAKSVLTNAPE